MAPIGRTLMIFGVLLLIIGFVMTVGGRFGLGRLPGDFMFRRGNTAFYFPLATSIIISLLLTFILNFFFRR